MSPRRHPHKKRRIRKKWCVQEYTEFGFDIRGTMSGTPSGTFVDEVIDFAEANNYGFGGGTGRGGVFSFFVTSLLPRTPGRLTEADKQFVVEWFRARDDVDSVVDGPLVDAWGLA